jgi:hypothetical protein
MNYSFLLFPAQTETFKKLFRTYFPTNMIQYDSVFSDCIDLSTIAANEHKESGI